ncbi:MAG: hypothetical protein EPN30_04485 [Actinomycetota bacterium]|nr:MAG: hypothetical protein EPN30_04485 [Actinomycetota bacterium]
MAKGSIGKQVARAAATGGGRTSRGEIPLGFYSALAVISIIGIFLVGYSRYELQHPVSKPVVHPVIGDNWNFAFGIYDCSTFVPNLPALPASAKTSFSTSGNGIINLSPKVAADEGKGATLGKLADSYKDVKFTSSSITVSSKQTIKVGASCNGKPTELQTAVWSSLLATTPRIYTGDPSKVVISSNDELVTIGLVPKGTSLPKPPSTSQLANVSATTTTAAPANTSTTAVPGKSNSTTTTTKGSSTTTTSAG